MPTAGAWRGGSDPRAARPDRPDEPPDLSGREPPLRRVGTPREASSSPFQGQRLQRLADGLTAAKVDALLRKWLARLPHPFNRPDRQQGIRYDISILQAEFALTQVFDRPAQGRVFFEEVVRENLDMGRPDHVQLIFDRRVSRRTPSRYRTRVISDGVTPSLHVDYKHSRASSSTTRKDARCAPRRSSTTRTTSMSAAG